MTKIKTLADLKKVQADLQKQIELREKGENPEKSIVVKIAMATCGIASGAKSIFDFFADEFDKRNINAIVTQTGCMGYCYAEPTVEVTIPGQESVVFGFVDLKKADDIIEKFIKNGEFIDGTIPVNYATINDKK